MSDAGGDLTVAAAHGGAAGSGANRRALRARATINYRDAVDWSNIALSSDSEDGGKRKERKRNRGGGSGGGGGGAGPASSGGAPAPTRAPRSIVPQPVSS
jgi:hypothetical protein